MTLDEYLSRPGSESMAEFARRLGLNADQVRQWRHGHSDRRPSPPNCAAIERASGGLVTCEGLRPDVVWKRVPDRSWPWHPHGKPLVDVLPPAPAPSKKEAGDAQPAEAHAASKGDTDPLQERREAAVKQLERALGIPPPARRKTDKPNACDRER